MELRQAWCAETAHPSYQKDWSESNPSYGQCAVTALLMQDVIGGEIYECKVNGKRHYINVDIEGGFFDYTSSQFGVGQIVYTDMKLRTRQSLLKCKNVKERYALLKARWEA